MTALDGRRHGAVRRHLGRRLARPDRPAGRHGPDHGLRHDRRHGGLDVGAPARPPPHRRDVRRHGPALPRPAGALLARRPSRRRAAHLGPRRDVRAHGRLPGVATAHARRAASPRRRRTASHPRPRPAPSSPRSCSSRGAALAVVGGLLHPHDEPPNSHAAVFAEYAHSTDWVWVHDLQFLSAAVVVAGLPGPGPGPATSRRRPGPSCGSATRRPPPPWPSSPSTWPSTASPSSGPSTPGRPPDREDRASRFAAAEAVRWLEWGVNSFFTILLGVTAADVRCSACCSQAHLGTRVRLAGVTGSPGGRPAGRQRARPSARTASNRPPCPSSPPASTSSWRSASRPWTEPSRAASEAHSYLAVPHPLIVPAAGFLPGGRSHCLALPSPRSRRMHAHDHLEPSDPRVGPATVYLIVGLPGAGQDNSREGAGDQRVGSAADAGRVAARAVRRPEPTGQA